MDKINPLLQTADDLLALKLSFFPCGKNKGKEPLVKWLEFQKKPPTEKQINKWKYHFKAVNIGLVTGVINNITVIDCDDPKISTEELEARFGIATVIVQTQSGGLHLYYAHNGEKNQTKIGGQSIDIRGEGGYVIIPPSLNSETGKSYSYLRGSLRDLEKLTKANSQSNDRDQNHQEGTRNNSLFLHLKDKASIFSEKSQLLKEGRDYNHTYCKPPLEDKEVCRTIESVWRYKEKGRLFAKGSRSGVIPEDIAKKLYSTPNAFVLYAYLRLHNHGLREHFVIIQEALIQPLGWNDARAVKKAIDILIEKDLLLLVEKGRGKGSGHKYKFSNFEHP